MRWRTSRPATAPCSCTAPRARTGPASSCAFALAAAGVEREAIVADYVATAERISLIMARLRASPTYAADLDDAARRVPRAARGDDGGGLRRAGLALRRPFGVACRPRVRPVGPPRPPRRLSRAEQQAGEGKELVVRPCLACASLRRARLFVFGRLRGTPSSYGQRRTKNDQPPQGVLHVPSTCRRVCAAPPATRQPDLPIVIEFQARAGTPLTVDHATVEGGLVLALILRARPARRRATGSPSRRPASAARRPRRRPSAAARPGSRAG